MNGIDITKPGFYRLSHSDYLADGALDKSFLTKFSRSGKHAHTPKKNTHAFIFGEAWHLAILEPKKYARRVKEKKSGYGELKKDGYIYLKTEDIRAIKIMKRNLWQKKTARKILKNAYAKELSGFWQLWTGDMAKIKIDIIAQDGLIYDLKTTNNASYDAFWWDFKKYKHHWQAAFYLEGVSKITGIEHYRFGFIVTEKVPPYETAFYDVTEAWIEQAWREMQPVIDKYTLCKEQDRWDGYPDEFINLEYKRKGA